MSNILIIGANRGLGLEFVKQYRNTNHNIIACLLYTSDAADE